MRFLALGDTHIHFFTSLQTLLPLQGLAGESGGKLEEAHRQR
jgi:hypothetical protein